MRQCWSLALDWILGSWWFSYIDVVMGRTVREFLKPLKSDKGPCCSETHFSAFEVPRELLTRQSWPLHDSASHGSLKILQTKVKRVFFSRDWPLACHCCRMGSVYPGGNRQHWGSVDMKLRKGGAGEGSIRWRSFRGGGGGGDPGGSWCTIDLSQEW